MDSWNDVAIIAVMATTFMYLEQYVMDYVDGATESNFLRQMATTFMYKVDWEEIAQAMVDDTAYVMA